MRIAILYNRDIHSNEALNHLIPGLAGHDLGLFFSRGVGANTQRDQRLTRLGFVEQTLFNDLVFPLVEQRQTLGRRLTFAQLADRAGCAETAIADINSDADRGLLAAFQPDVLVSIRFGQILQPPVLALPPHGTLNLHSGRLPQYRGVMATFWSLLDGADQLGMTLHWIDSEGIDVGPTIATTAQALQSGASYFKQTQGLYRAGVAALLGAIATIARGQLPESQLPTGEGRYFTFPDADALDRFESKGYRLFSDTDLQELMAEFLFPEPDSDAPKQA